MAWLERTLQEYPGTVVAVTHDRYFLDNVAGWILELDRGAGIPWEGNYSSWLEQKQARLAAEEKADRSRQASLERELEWIRMSPRARQSKGKARITAYNELVAEAESAERRADKVELSIPPGPRLGDQVVEAAGVVKAFGDRLLIDGLSFMLPPGGIVGVIGPNGAGKTTLFRMIVGEEQPDARHADDRAPSVQLAYVDQSRESLSPDATVFEEITGGVDRIVVGRPRAARPGLRGRLRLQGQRPAEEGGPALGRRAQPGAAGQGAHAAAATCCCSTSRPTTSTSTPCGPSRTRLLGFPGCAVVISHDRWFLDRIATHVLAFEGDSEVRWWEGNFSDYEADRHKRLGVDADQPHRIRYKPLVRD